MFDPQVLIVGAGPTGLNLAFWLKRLGIRIRIIDKVLEPGTTSRAIVVHARTLEFYQQLGLAQDILNQGLKFSAINLWAQGRQHGRVPLGDIGEGLSAFPFMTIYPQDEHEKFLIAELKKIGVTVERGTELIDFKQEDRVTARLRRADSIEEICSVSYIAGCDGAHSSVRKTLGLDFTGATYQRMFYVADVLCEGPVADGELHLSLDEAEFLAIFPLREPGQARLIGTILEDPKNPEHTPTWDDVGHLAIERLQLKVKTVNWFSNYRVHHRLADHFQRNRAFLLGDAAHIHSPVGGQGMNTGIGDAVNLAWKLADVLHGRCTEKILETYEVERRAFAKRLVATTDRAFTLVSNNGVIARNLRMKLVPKVLPKLLNTPFFRRNLFRTISQIAINYRMSFLSEGAAGLVQGGDRLPWIGENYEALAELNWQVHVYGKMSAELRGACETKKISLHVFGWRPEMAKAGLIENASYLIRPDGHIAIADPKGRAESLARYFTKYMP